ncbi:hypothetical protein BGX27_007731 [Mortierella sp. AM989]|nr:hypothetical protein BGX27_007731 [Mortierella sp. AM989]
MLGLSGLGTGNGSFTTPFFGLFRFAFKEPVRFTFQAFYLNLAKSLFRPTTLIFITAVSFIVFDLDFEVVWEEGDEDEEENDTRQWQNPEDFDRIDS